jgi:hypothetical protein
MLLAAAFLFSLGFAALGGVMVSRPELIPSAALFAGEDGKSNLRFLARGVGLAIWGLLFLRLRPHYRAAEAYGVSRPAWKAGLVCVLIGGGLSLLIAGGVAVALRA